MLTGCGSDEPDTVEATFTMPRTYEQLDLASPEATVDEFISAFVRPRRDGGSSRTPAPSDDGFATRRRA